MDETIRNYRTCFSGENGKLVLSHILADLGFFDEAKTPEDMVKRNCAIRLLKNLGIFDISNVKSFVNKLFEIPIQELKNGQES